MSLCEQARKQLHGTLMLKYLEGFTFFKAGASVMNARSRHKLSGRALQIICQTNTHQSGPADSHDSDIRSILSSDANNKRDWKREGYGEASLCLPNKKLFEIRSRGQSLTSSGGWGSFFLFKRVTKV